MKNYEAHENVIKFKCVVLKILVPLTGEKMSRHAHKAASQDLLGVLFKINREAPLCFSNGSLPSSLSVYTLLALCPEAYIQVPPLTLYYHGICLYAGKMELLFFYCHCSNLLELFTKFCFQVISNIKV